MTTTCSFNSSNNLTNGVAISRAKIDGSTLAALEHISEGCNVRLSQIHYMCIVADGRPVRGGVIRLVYLVCRFLFECCLDGKWNRIRLLCVVISSLNCMYVA